ncbi:MAG: MMPL family transporter [Thermoleophilaceae bacterium]|nr:MMPL family transporter [Thermoleophilaceae bacterium]
MSSRTSGVARPGAEELILRDLPAALGTRAVFILSRVREAYDNGMKTEDALSYAIKNTAGVIMSAAVVMVAVFAIFGSLSFIMFKQMGVGLAFAVLIDATVIRGILLPASMKLLGDRNWWLPRSLGWIPQIEHEGTARQPAPA